ncbi:MAG: ATP-binding protein [Crenarchaeota archaeon]|jgi:SpoVK/Ycf46/Vps4 family AAA+-type ATPase|nr:ATP-binding protein [Thermoproteota archaeon]
MEYSSEVLKIVEGALKSDKAKVANYTKLLVDKLKENNETRLANSFLKLLANNSVTMTQMSMNDSMKIPIDQESRFPMADVLQPIQAADTRVILNKVAYEQVDKFLVYYNNTNKLMNSGIHVPNTILLYGPPGCGKNKLAAYICAKIKLPLVTARLDGMISSYLGSTSKNIRAIFEYAQTVPCILFLDEFDAIAKVRDDNNELGELKRVVNSLLQNIDNLKNGSIIIAATNHDHLLDPAVWRRFGFKIPIDKPDDQSRKELIDLFLADNSFSDKEKNLISTALSGFSGADIEEICNKTTIDAVLQNQSFSLITVFNYIFEFLNIGRQRNGDNVTVKTMHRERAKYLRELNTKLFSYSQIASIFGTSKSYVSDLLKDKEGAVNE